MSSDMQHADSLEALLAMDPAHRRQHFHWDLIRNALQEAPADTLNIAVAAVDRQVRQGAGERIALRWLAQDGRVVNYSYRELQDLSNGFAQLLASLDIQPGERVFSLLGRVPELHIAALGTLKRGAVFCPLFSAFGPEPIATRLRLGEGRVLITTTALYRRKVAMLRDQLPELRHVLLIDDQEPLPNTESFHGLLAECPHTPPTIHTHPESMALLHFTSGTTGTPKGVVHVHEAVLGHLASAHLALDLRPGEIFWCTADPGWVTGISYGLLAPLLVGATNLLDEAEFQVQRWYRVLQEQQVQVWYTAPTAIRMLMKAGDAVAQGYDFSHLRFAASVGEPLNPEAVLWGERVLGQAFHDTWWQSETGSIMISNPPGLPVKPGAMGLPLPGIEAVVVKRDGQGGLLPCPANEQGELALRANWPSRLRGYLNNPERYQEAMVGEYYLSSDLVYQDETGYFWFVGRADDVIQSAGHLIGPFEVESALMEHPAVAEAGVIGKPDPTVMEIVKAFVTLKDGFTGDEALRRDIMGFARKRLGPSVAPREIDLVEELPKTRSGKIIRRALKAKELGLAGLSVADGN